MSHWFSAESQLHPPSLCTSWENCSQTRKWRVKASGGVGEILTSAHHVHDLNHVACSPAWRSMCSESTTTGTLLSRTMLISSKMPRLVLFWKSRFVFLAASDDVKIRKHDYSRFRKKTVVCENSSDSHLCRKASLHTICFMLHKITR